ncbi:MAG TPA: hypothetical protein VHC70_02005, partial [Phycisphaerales bacterium]|nr:hypothetical protein [Phycisphaerales bacterium]
MTPSLACVCVGLLALGLGAFEARAADPTTPPAAAPDHDPRLKNIEFLEQYAATRGFTHGTPKNIALTPDGSIVFFLRSGPRS